MRTPVRIFCLVVASLTFQLMAGAQSRGSNSIVSVRELNIPTAALHVFEQGFECLKKNEAVGSLPHFRRAIAEFPGYYEAYYMIGEADLKLWRLADAEQAFRTSIELSGGQYAKPQFALGAILDDQKKFAEAEGVTLSGLDLDPASWSGHYYLGVALFGLNSMDEAEKNAREALRLKNDSREARLLLIDIDTHEKDYRALVNDIDQYLKLDSASPSAVRLRALLGSTKQTLIEPQGATPASGPDIK